MSETHAQRDLRTSVARERLLVARANAQHGVLTTSDLRWLGVEANAIALRVDQRRLTRLHRGAYLLGPGPPSFRASCRAAILVTGGAVFGTSAARLHGFLRGRDGPVHVVVANQARSRAGVEVHHGLIAEEVVRVDGIRVTAWPRTVIDAVAQGADARTLLIAVERAEGTLDASALHRAFATGRGRAGIGAVRRALAEHHPLAHRCRSDEEVAYLYAIAAAGLPMPEVNNDANGFEVDFCWRALRVIAEVDGGQHRLLHQRTVDAVRDGTHGREGFEVLRFPARDVRERLEDVIAATAATLRRRKLLVGGSF